MRETLPFPSPRSRDIWVRIFLLPRSKSSGSCSFSALGGFGACSSLLSPSSADVLELLLSDDEPSVSELFSSRDSFLFIASLGVVFDSPEGSEALTLGFSCGPMGGCTSSLLTSSFEESLLESDSESLLPELLLSEESDGFSAFAATRTSAFVAASFPSRSAAIFSLPTFCLVLSFSKDRFMESGDFCAFARLRTRPNSWASSADIELRSGGEGYSIFTSSRQ
mmetsp:Transcript_2575/g.5389  ORF Transcript_2575/g.5389 Transcript_2575/m.5389 type:complete len:223 (-) Transcript_2575:93-761(-)